jgi:flagellar motor switch protein FliM
MTDSELRVFDFREIAALDDAATSLRNWIGKSSSFFSDFWNDVSDYAAPLSLGNVTTSSYAKTVEGLSRDVNYCMLEFVDYARSMWYASNRDFRLIAWAMLGIGVDNDAEESSADDGPLSQIERALVQLFVEELAKSMMDGWMGGEKLDLSAGAVDLDPLKARFLRESDLVTCTSIQIGLKSEAVGINWLLSKHRTSSLMESVLDRRRDGEEARVPKKPSPELVEQLPIDVVTLLGSAKLPMSQLSDLKVGQVVTLNQRIDKPVVAFVNDEPFFSGWPGKRGKNQALSITQCIDE